MQEAFIINDRYLVQPEKNIVIDRTTSVESRMEQRLLEVLYLLCATPNELVTRDEIVRVVWNEYGGADEGLTQAISFLRKVLGDKDKKIIETIPKKGYILNASVTPVNPVVNDEQLKPTVKDKTNKGKYVIALLMILGIATFIYLAFVSPHKENPSSSGSPSDVIQPSNGKGADIKDVEMKSDTTQSTNPDMLPDSLSRPK